jgi:hypothetical protein
VTRKLKSSLVQLSHTSATSEVDVGSRGISFLGSCLTISAKGFNFSDWIKEHRTYILSTQVVSHHTSRGLSYRWCILHGSTLTYPGMATRESRCRSHFERSDSIKGREVSRRDK